MDNLLESFRIIVNEEICNTVRPIVKEEISNTVKPIVKKEISNNAKINKIDKIEQQVNNHEKRLDNIETILASHDKKLKSLDDNMKFVKATLIKLEFEHGKKLDAIFDKLDLNQNMENLKSEKLSEISKKQREQDLYILNHENRISNSEKNFT